MNFRAMFLFSVGFLCLLCVMLPGSLRADTFTYTSNAYNDCFGTYCSIVEPITETITFTTTLTGSALDNVLLDIPAAEISSFSFTDTAGLSITQANVSDPGFFDFFEINTDGAGNITQWFIDFGYLTASGLSPFGFTKHENIDLDTSGSPIDNDVYQAIGGGFGSIENAPATWTDLTTATNAPEPSSLLLLGAGLLGLLALAARSKRRVVGPFGFDTSSY